MFVPVFGDPWSGSTYVRLPRSAPFHASAFEDPFAAYIPRHDQYAAPVAEPHCNCRSCAMARAAAAAQSHDFGIRPHFPSHAHHPACARTPVYHQQQHPEHCRHRCHQSPYAHAYAKSQAMPPCTEAVDDELYEGDQPQHEVTYDEPSYPAYPCFRTTTSRPASVHAALRPANFAGTGLCTEPERVTAQHSRPAPPCTAQSAAATPLQQQQQVQAPSVPATPTSRGRQIKVQAAHNSTPAAQPVAVHSSSSQPTGQQQRKPAQTAQPARQLSGGEAATIIQSWWRMRRLARQQPAVKALAAAATQLNNATAKFDNYKSDSSAGADSNGHLSHKQYAELNELAMRVLLQLDATSCGVSELRTVRKRLTATAIKLMDEIQGAYSAGVHSSMELSDADVKAAVQSMAAAAEAAPAAAEVALAAAESAVSTTSEQHQETQQDSAQKGQQPQQQLAAMHIDGSVETSEAGGEAAGPLSGRKGAVEGKSEDDDADNKVEAAVPELPAAAAESSCNVVAMADASEAPAAGYIAEQQSTQGYARDEVLQQHPDITQEQQQIGAEAAARVEQPVVEEDHSVAAMSNVPAGVRIVLVYPGSRVDNATQTE